MELNETILFLLILGYTHLKGKETPRSVNNKREHELARAFRLFYAITRCKIGGQIY